MIKTFENYNSEYLLVEKLELQPLFDQLKKSVNKKIIATIIVGSLLSILNPAQAINYIENNYIHFLMIVETIRDREKRRKKSQSMMKCI